ncbi:hypothetical protein CPB86DRAFT_698200, partial [Serendipita vermifera]
VGVGLSITILPAAYFLLRSPRMASAISRKGATAPPRRIATFQGAQDSVIASETVVASARKPLVKEYMSQEGIRGYMPSRQEITQSTVWLALRSFSIATVGVLAAAGAGVGVLIWSWDIQDIPDLHLKLRRRIYTLAPSLVAKIRRPVAASDYESSADMHPILASMTSEEIDSWTWDKAKARMDEAYERDGTLGWFAAAARELEIENQLDIRRRAKYDQTAPST